MTCKFPRNAIWWCVICMITAAVAWADWRTWHELSLFVFYFVPVGLAAWQLGPFAAVIESVLCASAWFAADTLSGHQYSTQLFAVWNTLVRLTAFIVIGWTIARIQRLLESERERGTTLRRTMAEIKILKGLLPICAQCKKIRDTDGRWHQLEVYISNHSDVDFTHGICQECAKELLEDAGM